MCNEVEKAAADAKEYEAVAEQASMAGLMHTREHTLGLVDVVLQGLGDFHWSEWCTRVLIKIADCRRQQCILAAFLITVSVAFVPHVDRSNTLFRGYRYSILRDTPASTPACGCG